MSSQSDGKALAGILGSGVSTIDVGTVNAIAAALDARAAKFNAIAALPARTLIYEELCHSCGGCARVCPSGAITETSLSRSRSAQSVGSNMNSALSDTPAT